MRLQTKKVIAREFLILVVGIILGFVFFICVEVYNSSLWDRWYNLNETTIQKQKILDSIKNIGVLSDTDQILSPPLKGAMPVNEYGIPIRKEFKDPLGLQAAYEKKLLELKNQSKQLKSDLSKLNKQLSVIESRTLHKNNSIGQFKFVKHLIIILLILLFGFRYAYYAVRWSIKTLREQ